MKFPKKHLLTFLILLGMLAGVAVGEWVYLSASTEFASSFAQNVKLLTTIFLRLIQMILAPLVLSTLIVGIAKMGDIKAVGRVGGKSMLWFFSASLVSLFLGLILVNYFEPGVGIKLSNVDTQSASELVQSTHGFSVEQFIQHVFPKSIIQSMAENEIL
jgi:Na+/H+-dicarboxylate symporter